MNKSLKRVRPGVLVGLLVIFAVYGWLVSSEAPTEKDRVKFKIIFTQADERSIAEILTEQAFKVGGITNLVNEFILSSLRTATKDPLSLESHTNASGQVVDVWRKPYQINLVGTTNFTIHSAGPNLKFGDADDIIFNSVSNDIAKP